MRCFIICILAGASFAAFGHEDTHERIAAVSAEMASRPGDADLYLKRGSLHYIEGHWTEALADLDRALGLDRNTATAHLLRAKSLMGAGHHEAAVRAASAYLEKAPEEAAAHLTHARALSGTGAHLQSASAYSAALLRIENPSPDLYLEYARTWMAAGSDYARQATLVLEEGMQRVGPVVTLVLEMVEVLATQARYGEAEAFLDRLLERHSEVPAWWVRKGELCRAAGRRRDAATAFSRARKILAGRSAAPRRTAANQDLIRRLDQGEGLNDATRGE